MNKPDLGFHDSRLSVGSSMYAGILLNSEFILTIEYIPVEKAGSLMPNTLVSFPSFREMALMLLTFVDYRHGQRRTHPRLGVELGN